MRSVNSIGFLEDSQTYYFGWWRDPLVSRLQARFQNFSACATP